MRRKHAKRKREQGTENRYLTSILIYVSQHVHRRKIETI